MVNKTQATNAVPELPYFSCVDTATDPSALIAFLEAHKTRQVIAGVTRITRPGGRVAALDLDLGTGWRLPGTGRWGRRSG